MVSRFNRVFFWISIVEDFMRVEFIKVLRGHIRGIQQLKLSSEYIHVTCLELLNKVESLHLD